MLLNRSDMIPLSYIFTPLIAAGIGYVTNDIAIRMLFRPHKAKYIFGRRVWFTPGVIPKEKGRIAASIGQAISANLMNHDVMKETLLSDEMLQKVGAAFDELVEKLTADREPLCEYLGHYMAEEELVTLEKSATQELSILVADKLVNSGLGKQIAHIAVEHALDKMQHGVAGLFRVDKVLGLVQGPTESHLAKNIDEMLEQKAPEMTVKLVAEGVAQVMDMPVQDLIKDRPEQVASTRRAIIQLYQSVIEEQLPKMLEALDISQIIERRINEMDMMEAEQLIHDIAKKELKAIVWFGALLGFVIGLLNCFLL